MRFIDYSGKRIGRLLVLYYTQRLGRDKKVLCRCLCGVEKEIAVNALRSQDVCSCGCYNRDVLKARAVHGEANKTPEYRAWLSLKKRCFNLNDPKYQHYGKRGITVCSQWLGSYVVFLADMGRKPGSAYSLDRIDVNGNYEPSNCRWATAHEQRINQRRMLEAH